MKNHITKNRKIAILGTKGVPNNYGGFEQFADFLSNKIKNINHSNEIRSSYISNNLNKVKNNYDWDIITNQVEELIIKRH